MLSTSFLTSNAQMPAMPPSVPVAPPTNQPPAFLPTIPVAPPSPLDTQVCGFGCSYLPTGPCDVSQPNLTPVPVHGGVCCCPFNTPPPLDPTDHHSETYCANLPNYLNSLRDQKKACEDIKKSNPQYVCPLSNEVIDITIIEYEKQLAECILEPSP